MPHTQRTYISEALQLRSVEIARRIAECRPGAASAVDGLGRPSLQLASGRVADGDDLTGDAIGSAFLPVLTIDES